MTSLFKAPKVTPLPPQVDAEAARAADSTAKRRQRLLGRKKTIFTSPQGVQEGEKRLLLGGQ